MKKLLLLIILALVISIVPLTATLGQALPPNVDQQKVLAAIDKGRKYLMAFLRSHPGPVSPHLQGDNMNRYADEFVLYTLVHIGVDPNNAVFQMLLKRVLDNSNKLQKIYRVAVLAMALEALDREKYQSKIAQCGQLLIDYQCKNGQWNYDGVMGKEMIQSGLTPEDKDKPATEGTTRAIKVMKLDKPRKTKGPDTGDNSNTQYALLGLRACMEAHVIIPKATFQLAEKWLLKSQNRDGGWNYQKGGTSYGSMTAGGLAALVICKHYQKRKYKKSAPVRKALKWLDNNFTVTKNPKEPTGGKWWHYYYLYGLERAGMLYDTKTFGKHDWYKEGAEYLIANQHLGNLTVPGGGHLHGAWFVLEGGNIAGWASPMVETCFALLFLRRATKPIISK